MATNSDRRHRGQRLIWFAVIFLATLQFEFHRANKRRIREQQYFITIAGAHIDTLRTITAAIASFDEAFSEHIRTQHPLLAGATPDNIYNYIAAEAYRMANGALPERQATPPLSAGRFANLLARLGIGSLLAYIQLFESRPSFCFSPSCIGFNAVWLVILAGAVFLLLSGVGMLWPRYNYPNSAAQVQG